MTLSGLLDSIRDYYLMRFKQEIDDYRKKGFEIFTEPELLDKSGMPITDGFFEAQYRYDLFVLKDNKPVESIMVDTESKLSFLPISLQWSESLTVKIEPFQWNFMTIELVDNTKDLDWTHLNNWFNFSFKEKTDTGDFKSAVHFISDPYKVDDNQTVDIDLGSGTVNDFENLLDALDKMNLNNVIVR